MKITQGFEGVKEGFSARFEGGVRIKDPDTGGNLDITGNYSGIGVSGSRSSGVSVKLSLPLN